jgi:hypothetical protein
MRRELLGTGAAGAAGDRRNVTLRKGAAACDDSSGYLCPPVFQALRVERALRCCEEANALIELIGWISPALGRITTCLTSGRLAVAAASGENGSR